MKMNRADIWALASGIIVVSNLVGLVLAKATGLGEERRVIFHVVVIVIGLINVALGLGLSYYFRKRKG